MSFNVQRTQSDVSIAVRSTPAKTWILDSAVLPRVNSPSLIHISSRSDRLTIDRTRSISLQRAFYYEKIRRPYLARVLIIWRRVAVGLARVTALWRGKIRGPYLARVYHTTASAARFRSFLAFTFLRDVKRRNRRVSWLVKSGPLSRTSKSQTSPLRGSFTGIFNDASSL